MVKQISNKLKEKIRKRPGKAKCIPEEPDKVLLPFQRRWINDRSRIKGAEKSRQIGWTWTDALDTVQELSKEHDGAEAGSKLDTWITSRDDFQAKLYLEDCKGWAKFLELGAQAYGETEECVIEWADKTTGKQQKSNAYMLPFASGGRAFSLSSNEDAQAGKRGSRKIDEFALHPRQRRLYGIALPGIQWGGQLAFFSTHRGSHSFFNELIKEIKEKGNPKKINLHRVTLEDALNQGLLFKLQQKWPRDDERQGFDETDFFNSVKAESADEETFLEEYMCVPSDDASAFLSFEMIDGVKYLHGVPWETDLEELTGEVYIGVDIGRRKDLTVIWVLEKLAGMWLTRKVIKLKKTPFEEQKKIISEVFLKSRCRRLRIDETGIGMNIAEDLRKRFGVRVEPVTFTLATKEEMAFAVHNVMEDKSLRIPDDREITAAFRRVRKEVSSSGNLRFVAEATDDGHADEFWALGLAITAGKRPSELKPPRKGRNPRRETTRRNRSILN